MEKYRKVRIIGEGSFAKAILVKNIEDDGLYVLKLIDISKMAKQQKEEAMNEVKVLKSLRHPFIISYRESFIVKNSLCIIMDYAEGGDLYSKITEQKKTGRGYSEDQIMTWFCQILLALKYIHDRKILHRDLKTQNIFLTANGNVKLGDFGIARVLQSTNDCAHTMIGTPYYLSPEICEQKPYNQKSDIWSLGCVLYEIATLRHAFDASSFKSLVIKIIRGKYPSVPSVYSEDLKELISDLLQRNPINRPSSKKLLERPIVMNKLSEMPGIRELNENINKLSTLMHDLPSIPESALESQQSPISFYEECKVPPALQKPPSSNRIIKSDSSSRRSTSISTSSEEESRELDKYVPENMFFTVEGQCIPGLNNVSSKFEKLEIVRMYIESCIGISKFLSAYEYLLDPPSDDDTTDLQEVMGKDINLAHLIYQLIMQEEQIF